MELKTEKVGKGFVFFRALLSITKVYGKVKWPGLTFTALCHIILHFADTPRERLPERARMVDAFHKKSFFFGVSYGPDMA